MSRILFVFILTAIAWADSWQGVERVVAVGDVHGSFEQFTTVLRQAKVINDKNKWIGGKTHLVQLGDIPDRGPDTRKVMDLLMDLEKQAKKAGGMVHALIGNHEAMNIYGDLRYTIAEEFASFRRSDSEDVRNRLWEQHAEELMGKGVPQTDLVYRKKWEAEHPVGWLEHRLEYQPNGKYGRWIREHDAVVKINDTLFLHGGLSPKYASMTVSDINKRVRKELSDLKQLDGGIVTDSDGPLWYRGLATGNEPELSGHVDALLQFHGAKRIVLGHTPTKGVPMSRFGGKIILADVGLGVAYLSSQACLIIEKGDPVAMNRGLLQPVPVADLIPAPSEAGK